MNNYADEEFYKTAYLCGKEAVITTAFDYYAQQSSQKIRAYTYGNINENNVPECVKMCCCELAELLFRGELSEQQNGGISSESVQGWSKSYESSEARRSALSNAEKSCIYKWLSGTGLLYAGVRRC